MVEHWDVIIIGAGPAGFTAGIYGARSGLRTLVIERKTAGGAAAVTPLIENYPGFAEGISGQDLALKMAAHCRKVGATINEIESVSRLSLKNKEKLVETDRAKYTASAIIVASGCDYRQLGVPGEKEFAGRGVSYCTTCDGPFFRGRKVLVVGGGNSAVVSAIFLANLASSVKLAHRRNQLRAEEALIKDFDMHRVEILWNTELKEIQGDATVKSAVLFNNKTGGTTEIDVDGVFVQAGEDPNSQVAKEAGVDVDEEGYIIVDERQRTNIEGVYAAGDVTIAPVKQIGTAVGQAIIAAVEVFGYIKRPYYYK
ncbi:MAG: thioredoxin-disulfide reductase [Candidatus Bathyarchaeota archaeon]|nr:thioredoxin-disulfide reductase [Candidatus Bathyarchaeota archaeon]MDH5733858.1 thioredoxin-disulfide reductase [Candidatus Bathyarchaeota archaeon]